MVVQDIQFDKDYPLDEDEMGGMYASVRDTSTATIYGSYPPDTSSKHVGKQLSHESVHQTLSKMNMPVESQLVDTTLGHIKHRKELRHVMEQSLDSKFAEKENNEMAVLNVIAKIDVSLLPKAGTALKKMGLNTSVPRAFTQARNEIALMTK